MKNLKKIIIYSTIVVLLIVFTVGATYAYFSATVGENQELGKSHQLEVIFEGDTAIAGNLELVRTKEEGFRREVNIGITENSVDAETNIYIYIKSITSDLATNALKWEVYKLNPTETEDVYVEDTVPYAKGTFANFVTGEKVYIVNNHKLSKTEPENPREQRFAVYVWLHGEEVGNEVVGDTLEGHIGAETEIITGDLS